MKEEKGARRGKSIRKSIVFNNNEIGKGLGDSGVTVVSLHGFRKVYTSL